MKIGLLKSLEIIQSNIDNQYDTKYHKKPFAQVFSCGMDRSFQHWTYLWLYGTSTTLFGKVIKRYDSILSVILKLITNYEIFGFN